MHITFIVIEKYIVTRLSLFVRFYLNNVLFLAGNKSEI